MVLKGAPPALALTSPREGKRSVPESRPPSPSWESRESRPEDKRVYTVRKELWPGGKKGLYSGNLCPGQEGEAATCLSFPVSLHLSYTTPREPLHLAFTYLYT